MLTEQQQVAIIRTMLHFIGKSQYRPTSRVVLAELRQMTASSTKGWDISQNQAPTKGPAPAGWNLTSNKKV